MYQLSNAGCIAVFAVLRLTDQIVDNSRATILSHVLNLIFDKNTFHRSIVQIEFLRREIEMHAAFHVHRSPIDKICNVQ
jgi:hypothetical protein